MLRKTSRWSALSEPNHFIAESKLHRFYRRNGNAVWSLATLCVVLSAFGYLTLRDPPRAGDPSIQEANTTLARVEPARERPREAVDFRRALTTTDQAGEAFRDLPPLRMPEIAQASPPVASPPAAANDPALSESAPASSPPAQQTPAPPPSGETARAPDTTAGITPRPEPTASVAPHPAPAPERPDAHAVVNQGDSALRRGEFEVARLHYREAMKAGDVLGAIGMAKSYDPLFLKSIGSDSKGSWHRAHAWYKRAAVMSGSPQARTGR